MALSNSRAEGKSADRKKTQPIMTAKNVKARERISVNTEGRGGFFIIIQRLRQRWLITRYIPCKIPQKTNVQFAPCHSPPKVIVTMTFINCRAEPFLFPPSGI